MTKEYKRGDHVEWNSEAGRVRGVIVKKVASDTRFRGYVHHASKEEPQYVIKSDKTNQVAIRKGRALERLKSLTAKRSATARRRHEFSPLQALARHLKSRLSNCATVARICWPCSLTPGAPGKTQ